MMKKYFTFTILFFFVFNAYGQEQGAVVSSTPSRSLALPYEAARKLTGISEQEIVRINEGLKKDFFNYRSVLGTEEDSLFEIVTRTYFRVAYPLIFKKDD